MQKIILLSFCAFVFLTASAQQPVNCPDYIKAMKRGNDFLASASINRLEEARKEFLSAKIFAKECRIRDVEATEGLNKINEMKSQIQLDSLNNSVKLKNESSIKIIIPVGVLKNNKKIIIQKHTTPEIGIDSFKKANNEWLSQMPDEEQKNVINDIKELMQKGKIKEIDTLVAYLTLVQDAREYEGLYSELIRQNSATLNEPGFWEDQAGPIPDMGFRNLDLLFFWGWAKAKQAQTLVPSYAKNSYEPMVRNCLDSLRISRDFAVANYLVPDAIFELPNNTYFSKACSDNQNFAFEYTDADAYIKKKICFKNLRLHDFTFTTDSIVQLKDNGKFYKILGTAANYQYKVGREINYELSNSKIAYKTIEYADPEVIHLFDNKGNMLFDFSEVSTGTYFFSPDANFIACFSNDPDKFWLFDVKAKQYIKLLHSESISSFSFSADGKRITYYDPVQRVIYIAGMKGQVLDQIPCATTALGKISNVDFTGNDRFLKINEGEKHIYLFDLENKKFIFNFEAKFVKDIVASPDQHNFLITCNSEFEGKDTTYAGYITFLVDKELKKRSILYSNCSDFLFTPNGDFIIGYGETSILRWSTKPTINTNNTKPFQSCLSYSELLEEGCLSTTQFAEVNDARLIENGARKLKDIAEEQTNSILKQLYYKQSKFLFDRLKNGDAENLQKQNIPFFYDWSNLLARNLGDKDYQKQFELEKKAVGIFDELLNSPDSAYPRLLYYAANANMLLSNLYDSMSVFNEAFINLVKKEIAIRGKAFEKDPDHSDNVYYMRTAFDRMGAVYANMGRKNLANKEYTERVTLFKNEEIYLSEKIKSLPDSFELADLYLSCLKVLSPSLLYVYARDPSNHPYALDSAFMYIDAGLQFAPTKLDSAHFLSIKARAYLLQQNGYDKALKLYRTIRNDFPVLTKEVLLDQLKYLSEAGGPSQSIQKIIAFLNGLSTKKKTE